MVPGDPGTTAIPEGDQHPRTAKRHLVSHGHMQEMKNAIWLLESKNPTIN